MASGAHPRAGLVEVGPESGIAEAILSTGVQVVPLSLDEVVAPSVVVFVNNSRALASPSGKFKFGPWPNKHKADERKPLTQACNMFSLLAKFVQGGTV